MNLSLERYFNALEEFKREHPDEVTEFWKSEKEFDKMLATMRKKEKQIARDAIKTHGSIQKYEDEMIANLQHLSELVDEMMSGN